MSGTFPDEVKAMARLVCRCARSRSNFDVRPCLRKQTFQITKGPGECRMRFTTSSRFCGKSPLQHSQKILSSYAHIDYVDFIDKSLEMDFWDIVGAPLRCVVFFVTQQELPLPRLAAVIPFLVSPQIFSAASCGSTHLSSHYLFSVILSEAKNLAFVF